MRVLAVCFEPQGLKDQVVIVFFNGLLDLEHNRLIGLTLNPKPQNRSAGFQV